MAIGSITHFFDASGFGGLGGLKDGTTATLSAPSSVLSANVSDDDSVFNFDGDETVAAGSPVGTPGDTFDLVAVNYELTNPAGVTHALFLDLTAGALNIFIPNMRLTTFSRRQATMTLRGHYMRHLRLRPIAPRSHHLALHPDP